MAKKGLAVEAFGGGSELISLMMKPDVLAVGLQTQRP